MKEGEAEDVAAMRESLLNPKNEYFLRVEDLRKVFPVCIFMLLEINSNLGVKWVERKSSSQIIGTGCQFCRMFRFSRSQW